MSKTNVGRIQVGRRKANLAAIVIVVKMLPKTREEKPVLRGGFRGFFLDDILGGEKKLIYACSLIRLDSKRRSDAS